MAIDVVPATAGRDEVEALDRKVRSATGHEAFNEAVWIDLAHPQRTSGGFFARDGVAPLGFAHVARADNGAAETWMVGLAVDPDAPAAATTAALLDAVVAHVAAHGGGTLVYWRLGPSDDEDARLRALGFTVARELYQMRVPLPLEETPVWPPGITTRTFRPGADDAAWLGVNNRAFAGHAEQGNWTEETLARRLGEPWFDPTLFLLAVDDDGIIGFNWCKRHAAAGSEPALGEIFAIGVDDRGRGRGIGRPLAIEGLGRMAATGIRTGMLYCAADNDGALRLYRSLGFAVHRADRAYERTVLPHQP
jgi:mycothiol synthase